MSNALSWLADLDSAVEVLAEVAVTAKKARAVHRVKEGLAKRADPMTAVGNDVQRYAIDPLKPYIGEEAAKHTAYGLLGAGVGAGVGGLTQLFAEPKKRRTLSSMLSGGLLGASVGASGSALHSHWDKLPGLTRPGSTRPGGGSNNPPPGLTAEEVRLQREIQERASSGEAASGGTNPQVGAEMARFGIDQSRAQELGLMMARQGPEVGRDAFLHQMSRNPNASHSRFTLPDDFSLPAIRDSAGNETAPALTLQAIRERLRFTQGPGGRHEYHWETPDLSTSEGRTRRETLNRILDHFRDRATEGGLVTPGGRVGTDINSRWDQTNHQFTETAPARITSTIGRLAYGPARALSTITRPLGLPNYIPGASPNSGGLMQQIAERGLPNYRFTPQQMNAAAFQPIHQAGFHPVQILEAYRNGDQAREALIDQAVADGVARTVNGQRQPWTREELRAALPQLMQTARDAAQSSGAHAEASGVLSGGMNSWFAPSGYASAAANQLRGATLGWGPGVDLAAGMATVDGGMTAINAARNRLQGYDLNHLIRGFKNGTLTHTNLGLTESQFNYLRGVAQQPGGNAALQRLFAGSEDGRTWLLGRDTGPNAGVQTQGHRLHSFSPQVGALVEQAHQARGVQFDRLRNALDAMADGHRLPAGMTAEAFNTLRERVNTLHAEGGTSSTSLATQQAIEDLRQRGFTRTPARVTPEAFMEQLSQRIQSVEDRARSTATSTLDAARRELARIHSTPLGRAVQADAVRLRAADQLRAAEAALAREFPLGSTAHAATPASTARFNSLSQGVNDATAAFQRANDIAHTARNALPETMRVEPPAGLRTLLQPSLGPAEAAAQAAARAAVQADRTFTSAQQQLRDLAQRLVDEPSGQTRARVQELINEIEHGQGNRRGPGGSTTPRPIDLGRLGIDRSRFPNFDPVTERALLRELFDNVRRAGGGVTSDVNIPADTLREIAGVPRGTAGIPTPQLPASVPGVRGAIDQAALLNAVRNPNARQSQSIINAVLNNPANRDIRTLAQQIEPQLASHPEMRHLSPQQRLAYVERMLLAGDRANVPVPVTRTALVGAAANAASHQRPTSWLGALMGRGFGGGVGGISRIPRAAPYLLAPLALEYGLNAGLPTTSQQIMLARDAEMRRRAARDNQP